MNFAQTLRCLKFLPPRQSVFIKGRHGMGKSKLVFQAARELSKETGIPYIVVDLRLSQYELGDMIGIPRSRDTFEVIQYVYVNGELTKQVKVATNVMVHDIPLWFPTDPNCRGFLFLDEMDRAGRDLHNWSMQLVNDYISNFVELPMGINVIAAGNGDDDTYDTRSLDHATNNRYQTIDFKPTVDEWIVYAKENGIIDPIIKYIEKFGTNSLDAPLVMERGVQYPSRRSWEKLSDRIKYLKSRGDDIIANIKTDSQYFTMLASGFIGCEAINFIQWVETSYKVYTAEEILKNFPKMKDYFETLVATDYTYYNKQLVDYIKDVKLTVAQQRNFTLYAQTIPNECARGLWVEFKCRASDEATRWYNIPENLEFLKRITYLKVKE